MSPPRFRHRAWQMLLPACLVLFATASPADYQAGLDAYQAGDYVTAMAEWKAEVNRQDGPENLAVYREALYAIGMLHWQGHGVVQDYAVAAVWLKQAADINHPGAQVKLGYLHVMGEGLPRNYQEAARWFQMAAAQGDPDARHNLDLMYSKGLLQPADEAPALFGPGGEETVAEEIEAQFSDVAGRDAGEGWILAQDPEHYTIQVIALSNTDKLQGFIAAHEGWSPFAIYRQTRQQKPIWVLVQGRYADVEAARRARDEFPAGLQDHDKLWIRKFGRVQRLIE